MARAPSSAGGSTGPSAVLRAIESGSLAPAYLLYGDEPHGIGEVVTALRSAVLAQGMEAFNHERFEGRELDTVVGVIQACRQLPLFTSRRLVELSDPEQVGEKKGSGDAKAEAAKQSVEALLKYLADPNPTTVLVLTSRGIDGRSRLVTATKKIGVVQKFAALSRDADAVGFVRSLARERGWDIDSDAAEAIVEAVGTSQAAVVDALERAWLHAGTGQVTRQDVAAVVMPTREAVVFDLTDAVGMGNRREALGVVDRLFSDRSIPPSSQALMLVGLLARQVRLVWTASLAGPKTAQVAGVPPFVARKLQAQAQRFDEARLRRAHAGLVQLDMDLKGGSPLAAIGPRILVERWIVDVCDGPRRPAAERR